MKSSARKIFYSLPPAWRYLARRLYYLPLDTWESVTGQRDELTPPRGMIFTGGGDFRKTGDNLLEYFREYCNLQPDAQVLDVGSGIGRIAVALTGYLNETGSYDGFDVVERGVDWCRDHISSRFPNFRFRYVPLKNDLYRASGNDPQHFSFPYEGKQFDLVVVNSVFTHMVPDEADHYFGEIRRVLKPGGSCYATFFLFDEERPDDFPEGFGFPYDHGHYRLMDEAVRSANVAYGKAYLTGILEQKHRFAIRHLFPGSWRGLPREACKEFQDIVIFGME